MFKKFSLKNKNIILTGAAGILGKALSQSFLDAGANLALIDINKTALDKISKTLKVRTNNYFNTYFHEHNAEQTMKCVPKNKIDKRTK